MNIGIVSIIIQGLMMLCIIWILFRSNAEITEKCEDITEILKEGRNNLTRIGKEIADKLST